MQFDNNEKHPYKCNNPICRRNNLCTCKFYFSDGRPNPNPISSFNWDLFPDNIKKTSDDKKKYNMHRKKLSEGGIKI